MPEYLIELMEIIGIPLLVVGFVLIMNKLCQLIGNLVNKLIDTNQSYGSQLFDCSFMLCGAGVMTYLEISMVLPRLSNLSWLWVPSALMMIVLGALFGALTFAYIGSLMKRLIPSTK